jgi:hypothetical protein
MLALLKLAGYSNSAGAVKTDDVEFSSAFGVRATIMSLVHPAPEFVPSVSDWRET